MLEDVFHLCNTTIDGRYRVDAVVGEGGFGIVYRGFHLRFNHPVAIKCLKVPPHFTPEAHQLFFHRFREEGAMLSKLSTHPSIIRVFDFGVTPSPAGFDVPFLVLEWLQGKGFDEWLVERAGAPLREPEVLMVLRSAVDALAVAHSEGIAHRDIKPANLMLVASKRGQLAKVLDFGVAKAMQEGESATQRVTRTSSGFNAFSPQFGAPEQFWAKKFGPTGPWTDVHALGLIMVQLTTGRPAYDGSEPGDFFAAATGDQRPTPRTRGATVSDAFEALCARALASMPAHRFQDARELLEAMDAAAGGRPSSPSFPGIDLMTPAPTRTDATLCGEPLALGLLPANPGVGAANGPAIAGATSPSGEIGGPNSPPLRSPTPVQSGTVVGMQSAYEHLRWAEAGTPAPGPYAQGGRAPMPSNPHNEGPPPNSYPGMAPSNPYPGMAPSNPYHPHPGTPAPGPYAGTPFPPTYAGAPAPGPNAGTPAPGPYAGTPFPPTYAGAPPPDPYAQGGRASMPSNPYAMAQVTAQAPYPMGPAPYGSTTSPSSIDSRPHIAPPPTQRQGSGVGLALKIGLGIGSILVGATVVGSAIYFMQTRDDGPAELDPTELLKQRQVEAARQAEEAAQKERDEAKKWGLMVPVAGGTFKMGSDENEDEKPVHAVTVLSFEMDVTEVTVAAFRACVDLGHCTPAATLVGWGANDFERNRWLPFCNFTRLDRLSHPINCVDAAQAQSFCASVGKRLPTEEEWEYTARGGSEQRKFPWGADAPSAQRLNACDQECELLHRRDLREPHELMHTGSDGWEATAPVGSYAQGASKFGVLDMAGNVAEWTSTIHCPYSKPGCTQRTNVLRGGGWRDGKATYVRNSNRSSPGAGWRDNADIGFRCARSRP